MNCNNALIPIWTYHVKTMVVPKVIILYEWMIHHNNLLDLKTNPVFNQPIPI